MKEVGHLEVLQETIRVLQRQRNGAMDQAVSLETSNKLLTDRYNQLLEKLQQTEKDHQKFRELLSSKDTQLMESAEKNAHLMSQVELLTQGKSELEAANQKLQLKLKQIRNINLANLRKP